MTGKVLLFHLGRPAIAAFVVGFAGLLVLAGGLAFAPVAVAQGWLLAFLFWSGIPIGSLILMLIHRLVGGRWGVLLAPVLLPTIRLMPLAAIMFFPIAFGLSVIFPWAAQPAALPSDVGRFYLNTPGFLIRTVVALGGWSFLSIRVLQGRCTKLIAGLGLAFHGLAISFIAIDWILSINPAFASTAFAASIAIQQILAALACAVILAPRKTGDPAIGDIGALLLAALLGLVYLGFMSYLVVWYGDLPEKATWYLQRSTGGWGWTIASAVGIGAAVPVILLLRSSIRQSRFALRVIGCLALSGIWLHLAWLVAPMFDSGWLIATIICLISMTGISLGLITSIPSWSARSIAHAA